MVMGVVFSQQAAMRELFVELDHLHCIEKGRVLEAVEFKKKAELLQLKFEFISHYLLGIEVNELLPQLVLSV